MTAGQSRKLFIRISETLKKLGISPSKSGYLYIRDGIYLYVTHPEHQYKITKELYPYLSEKYQKTQAAVEKSMRTAIETGYNNCSLEYSNEVFANIIRYDKGKPTNNEFITTVSEYIILEL